MNQNKIKQITDMISDVNLKLVLVPLGGFNVCSPEKLTKRCTVLLLCLVSFSAEQTLEG